MSETVVSDRHGRPRDSPGVSVRDLRRLSANSGDDSSSLTSQMRFLVDSERPEISRATFGLFLYTSLSCSPPNHFAAYFSGFLPVTESARNHYEFYATGFYVYSLRSLPITCIFARHFGDLVKHINGTRNYSRQINSLYIRGVLNRLMREDFSGTHCRKCCRSCSCGLTVFDSAQWVFCIFFSTTVVRCLRVLSAIGATELHRRRSFSYVCWRRDAPII